MKKIITLTLLMLSGCSVASSMRYNYYENRFETAAPTDRLTYNFYENEWKFAPADAQRRFNIYENKWELTR